MPGLGGSTDPPQLHPHPQTALTRDGVDHRPENGGGLYQFFEDVGLSSQGEPIVQHLFQYLVDHNHIVFDDWLWTDSKIVLVKTKQMYSSPGL